MTKFPKQAFDRHCICRGVISQAERFDGPHTQAIFVQLFEVNDINKHPRPFNYLLETLVAV